MHRGTKVLGLIAVIAWGAFTAHQVLAYPSVARQTKLACAGCHTDPAGGAALNEAGTAYKADATKVPTGEIKGADFVGGNKCKMCHMKQYKAWAETPHAHALTKLAAADTGAVNAMAGKLKVTLTGTADKTDACVTCHVTGFSLASGYPQADSTKNANLAFVGCEGCHGPGSLHVAAKTPDERKKLINKAPSEGMCKDCHSAETSPNFKFAEYKVKVHPVAAAAPTK